MNLRLKLIASVFVCLISAMDVSEAVELVRCDGVYPHHLQGVCQDTDGNLYWSFTTTLVKTDSEGQVLKKLEVANHHGDLLRHLIHGLRVGEAARRHRRNDQRVSR